MQMPGRVLGSPGSPWSDGSHSGSRRHHVEFAAAWPSVVVVEPAPHPYRATAVGSGQDGPTACPRQGPRCQSSLGYFFRFITYHKIPTPAASMENQNSWVRNGSCSTRMSRLGALKTQPLPMRCGPHAIIL